MTPAAILRKAGRALRVGPLALYLVRQPIARMIELWRDGGPRERRRTEAGRQEMIAAAVRLPPLVAPGDALPIAANFLSGDKYWHQTLFCFYSLQQQLERRLDATIFDDGTFTPPVMERMRLVAPWLNFVSAEEVAERLDMHLPVARYPSLRARRLAYPHLRKLTDIHCAATEWSLVLDSDMLAFRRPDALVDWMAAPDTPIYMQDVKTAYGYSAALLNDLTGRPVPPRVNVGLYTVRGDAIDWERVEFWCAEQMKRAGPHYLQEQALVAMLLADMSPRPLPRTDYVVMPSRAEGAHPCAVLHHYVAHSKLSYYQIGWRTVAARAEMY